MSLLGVVELGQIVEVIWVSIVAGVGITAIFSFVVLGSARSGEARRAGRPAASLAYALLAALCLAAFAAVVVAGVQIMLSKEA